MSEKIEVGEYVRTENGSIGKFKKYDKEGVYQYFQMMSKGTLYTIPTNSIVKHSKNIIELIEECDWVNGQHVKEVKNGYVMVGNGIDGFQIWEEDIRTIVTKEQFKSVEYEVK